MLTTRHSEQKRLRQILRSSVTNVLVASARMKVSQDVCARLVVPGPRPRWVRVDTEPSGVNAEEACKGACFT